MLQYIFEYYSNNVANSLCLFSHFKLIIIPHFSPFFYYFSYKVISMMSTSAFITLWTTSFFLDFIIQPWPCFAYVNKCGLGRYSVMDSGSLKANVVYPQLKEFKDTISLYIFTLDLVTNNYPVITAVEVLPFHCFALTLCSTITGGVIILASNTMQILQYIR